MVLLILAQTPSVVLNFWSTNNGLLTLNVTFKSRLKLPQKDVIVVSKSSRIAPLIVFEPVKE